MPLSLKHHVTSAYIDAAQRLGSKHKRRRIVAYVESYDDIAFWRNILAEFENEERYFQVMLPSSTSLTKGKKMVLMNNLNTDALGTSMIACVDSDYDYLMQDATHIAKKINSSPYIFQTYGYAIESFMCYAESLHDVCVNVTLNDGPMPDFEKFMKRYSLIAHPLFVWNIWFYRQRDTKTFPMAELNQIIRIGLINLNNPFKVLDRMEEEVSEKLSELRTRFPQFIASVDTLSDELEKLGVTPENTYLFIQGHHLMDDVVMKLLIPVCSSLRHQRENDIRRLSEHEQQYQNEMSGYENSQAGLSLMLRRNTNFRNLNLYQWIKEDIGKFLNSNNL